MPRPAAIYEIKGAAKAAHSSLLKDKNFIGLKEFVIAILNAVGDSDILDRKQLIEALKNHIAPTKPNAKGEIKPGKSLSACSSMISQRVKELEDLGCMRIRQEYKEISPGKRRKFTIHTLISLKPLIDHLNNQSSEEHKKIRKIGRPRQKDLVVYSDMLVEDGISKLEADGEITPYTEGAFSILESAARSRSDKEKTIECHYYIKKDDVLKITAATSTRDGASIMYSSDMRVIQALNGMLRQAHEEMQADFFYNEFPTRLIGEYCFFDLVALTREIGLGSNSKVNRDNVIKMIGRLRDTTFSVDATHSEYWRNKFMPDSKMNKGEYRYILEYYSAEDYYSTIGNNKENPENTIAQDRFFVIKFHPLILNAMTTPKLGFISHDSLKSERLDLVHRFNNWVKPVVGVRPKPNTREDHHQYTLDTLHQRVRPAARLPNFERDFMTLAERQNKKEILEEHEESKAFEKNEKGEIVHGVFWLNGYYFKIEKNTELALEIYRKARVIKKRRLKDYPVITIWRDRKDKIVGDESSHNQALRRQLLELNSIEREKEGSEKYISMGKKNINSVKEYESNEQETHEVNWIDDQHYEMT